MRARWYLAFLLVAMPAPLVGQTQPAVAKTSGGYKVDFANQDIKVVLSALAEAAGANITFSNLPPTPTTLHLGQPVPKEQLLDIMRNLAEQNGLSFAKEGSLVRIGRAQQGGTAAGGWTGGAPRVELYTYRLKHAHAADIAPLLMNLFAGTTLDGGPPSDGSDGANSGPGNGGGGIPQLLFGNGANGNAIVALPPSAGNGGGNGGGGIPLGGGGGGGGTPTIGASCIVNGQPVDCGQIGGGLQNLFQQLAGNGNQASQGQGNGGVPTASQVRVVAEESTNTLLIRATAQEWDWIQKILKDVDLRPMQVLIEAVIVEVTRTQDLNVGVDATVTNASHGQSQKADLPSTPNARDFLLQLVGNRGNVNFTAALNALASRGELRVRSLPVIVGQNNKQAVLNVGSSRPFVAMSQTVPNDPTNQVRNTQYIDVGTKLQITPRINADGYVNLEVAQTANTATNEIQFDAPVINKREATTQVFLKDGQTTVLGGLSDNTRDETRSGIPVLRDIPILGALFGSTHKNTIETELYVFLTPHIIAEDNDIDRLRDSLQRYSPELRKDPVVPIFPGPTKPAPTPKDVKP